METIGIRELRQNASQAVRQVSAGETFIVTDRGREVARLVPFTRAGIDRLIASGTARPPLEPLSELPEPTGTGDLSAALQELRAEESH